MKRITRLTPVILLAVVFVAIAGPIIYDMMNRSRETENTIGMVMAIVIMIVAMTIVFLPLVLAFREYLRSEPVAALPERTTDLA